MYKKTKKDEICLCCDGIADEDSGDELETCKKRKISKREQLENEVEENFKQLKNVHGGEYSIPLLRLWARVIANGHHDSLDEPPSLPQFKTKKNPSLKTDDMSPCKVADTRGKYIGQLQQIKSLEEEGVLTSVEYAEQKEIILCNLKKLK